MMSYLLTKLLGACRTRRRQQGRYGQGSGRSRLALEVLEDRAVPSATALPTYLVHHLSAGSTSPASSPSPQGLTPTQIRHAYAIDQIQFGNVVGDGTGQTIAIVDAFDDPTIASDLHQFDQAFGLPDPPSFKKVAQDGSTNYPTADSGWAVEISLDVEWAHALAPKANVLLVEANDNSYANLLNGAVNYAKQQPGVSVVSMSFGGGEFSSETSFDSVFTTPSGHSGVTFLASTGDTAAPGGYPSWSPNVVAVGGTTLTLSGNNYGNESGWSGSGGGRSQYEAKPSYQQNVDTQNATHRATPDVSFDADPNSGVPVYDSYTFGSSTPWVQVGGTSFSAPSWAALVAIADQGRALNGNGSLDGPSQTLPRLYALPSSDFHDITTGNNGFSAGPGYDLVTGRGTPIANLLVLDLAGYTSTGPLNYTAPSGNGTNTIVLRVNGSNIEVLDNSTVVASQAVASTTSVTITAGANTMNVVYVQNTVAGIPTTIVLKNGQDSVTVGNNSLLQGITGTLTIQGAAGAPLIVDDSADPMWRVPTITSSGISGLAPAVINTVNVDTVVIDGGTGCNTYTVSSTYGGLALHDASSTDLVFLKGGHVSVYGGPGVRAYLYDQAGTSTVDAHPSQTWMSGSNYYYYLSGAFPVINFYALHGTDTAYLFDAPGTNTFYGAPTYATMYANSYDYYLTGFTRVVATALAGNDTAWLHGDSGTNVFFGRPTDAYLSNGSSSWNEAIGFAVVQAFADGGSDTAYLFDGPGNNTFYSNRYYAYLSGNGSYFNFVSGFKSVNAFASLGNDKAYLDDSYGSSSDIYVNAGSYAYVQGNGYFLFEQGFASLVYVPPGGSLNGAHATAGQPASATDGGMALTVKRRMAQDVLFADFGGW